MQVLWGVNCAPINEIASQGLYYISEYMGGHVPIHVRTVPVCNKMHYTVLRKVMHFIDRQVTQVLIPNVVHLRPLASVRTACRGPATDDDDEFMGISKHSPSLPSGRPESWVTPDCWASGRDSLEG